MVASRTLLRFCVPLVAGALLLPACDDDSETGDTGDEATSGTGPTSGPDDSGDLAQGRCAPDVAVQSCTQTDCAFEVTEVDCAAACANIATLCANASCDAQCTGLESDMTLCTAGCEAGKNLACSNVVFGCYTTNSGCEDVGSCVEANV